MKIEIRNGAEIRVSGYVNAVERDSRVLPPEMACGASSRFVEKVGAGAFKRAIERNPNVRLCFNHEREIGSVSGGQLKLREDNIGLHAEAVITDAEVVTAAKRGELRGWSFGFSGARSSWENIGGDLKRRTLTDFDLSEVSILTKTPAYVGTSVEMRSVEPNGALEIREVRGYPDTAEIIERPNSNTENTSDSANRMFAQSPQNGGTDAAEQRVTGAFFIAQKELELLKLKGDL